MVTGQACPEKRSDLGSWSSSSPHILRDQLDLLPSAILKEAVNSGYDSGLGWSFQLQKKSVCNSSSYSGRTIRIFKQSNPHH